MAKAKATKEKKEMPDSKNSRNIPSESKNTEFENGAKAGEAAENEAIVTLEAQLEELKDKYLRLYADFENYKRRTTQEKRDSLLYGSADLMKAILPVVDDFERSKEFMDNSTELAPIKEGVDLIYNKLTHVLESKGLKPMNVEGQTFDADIHESIAQMPAPNPDLKGKIIDETQKGYYLNDRVIRFPKVVVGT